METKCMTKLSFMHNNMHKTSVVQKVQNKVSLLLLCSAVLVNTGCGALLHDPDLEICTNLIPLPWPKEAK